jgi:hypothetical protein
MKRARILAVIYILLRRVSILPGCQGHDGVDDLRLHWDPSIWTADQALRNALDTFDPRRSALANNSAKARRKLISQDSSQICAQKEIYCAASDVFSADVKSALSGSHCTQDAGGQPRHISFP